MFCLSYLLYLCLNCKTKLFYEICSNPSLNTLLDALNSSNVKNKRNVFYFYDLTSKKLFFLNKKVYCSVISDSMLKVNWKGMDF